MTDRETSLYRAYDSQNNLLYIGVSYNFDVRKVQHGYYSEWFEQADRFELETFESRVLAETAERDAIQSERPIWNKAHHPEWDGSCKTKSPLNVTIDTDLLDRLDVWMKKQVVHPTKSATVEKAISDLLDKHNG